MSYSEILAERVRKQLPGSSDIQEKRMFGGMAFLHQGRMFCGILGEELMVRVGKDAHARAEKRPGTRPMDFTGRPMEGYLFVSGAGIRTAAALSSWVRECLEHVQTLPAKKAAKPRARKVR